MAPQAAHVQNNPLMADIDQETAIDHSKAKARGERVLMLAESVASRLNAAGLLRGSERDAVSELVGPIADDLYGNAAIDTPTMQRRAR